MGACERPANPRLDRRPGGCGPADAGHHRALGRSSVPERRGNDYVTRTVLGLACPGRRVRPHHPVNGGHPVSGPIQNTPDGAGFRDGLVVMLTLSTGALDAVTFL